MRLAMRLWLVRRLERVGGTLCLWAYKLDVPTLCIDCGRESVSAEDDCPYCAADIERDREFEAIYEEGAAAGYADGRRDFDRGDDWYD